MDLPDLALALVECAPILAVDTETTGLDARSDRVCGWVFTACGHSLYVPVRHSGGGNLFDDPTPFEHALSHGFAKRSRLGLKTVGHNLPFDCWFAAKESVLIDGPLEDTMLNAVLINDDLRDYDLAACADRHKVTAKKGEQLYEYLQNRFSLRGKPGKKMMAHFHRLAGDDPMAVEYAVGDGISTLELWQAQQPILDAHSLRRVHALECALLPYIARMRRRGIRVDLAYAKLARERISEDLEAALMLMPAGFEANSAASVQAYMEAQGIRDYPWTRPATGKPKPSFRSDWLEESDAGQRVVAIRRLLKTRDTFLTPVLETHAIAERIHPDLVQFATGDYGTHTGRFSCRIPNLQAYPKRNKEIGQIVRPILIPDDGMIFGEADVSQQEPRLYAHYGEDEHLIAGYNAEPPTDVHTIASRAMNIDRDRAKTLGLSIFNGMQGKSLAARLKVDRMSAENLIEDFLDEFPGIRQFRREAPGVARARGYIRTLLDRRAYFMDPRSIYMAVSRIIQGSAADQMKLMMLRAFEYADAYPQVELLMSIHDSIMFQAEQGFGLSEFQRVLEDNSVLNLRVPMPVELKTGRHWGEASYGPEAYSMKEAA